MTIPHADEAAASTLSPAHNPNPGNLPAQAQGTTGAGGLNGSVASSLCGAQGHHGLEPGSVVFGG